MAEKNVNASRSPSPEDSERLPKRQRSDPSNLRTSSNDSLLETDRNIGSIQEECETFFSRLRQIETAASHELAKSFEKKRKQLEMQVQLGTETIRQLRENLLREKSDKEESIARLQEDVKRSEKDIQDAREAQTAAAAELVQLRTVKQKLIEIIPLIMPSTSDNASTAGQSHSKNIQLKETKISIERMPQGILNHINTLEAKAKRADKLEEELQLARATISSFRRAQSKQQSSMQQRIVKTEKVRQQMKILKQRLEMLSSKIGEDASMHNSSVGNDGEMDNSSGVDVSSVAPDLDSPLSDHEAQEASSEDEYAPSDDKTDDDEESSIISVDGEQRTDDSPMFVGKKRLVLVTSSKFFELNWNNEFTRTKENEWVCKKCSHSYTNRERMKDHVWTAHYGGKFQCAQCTRVPKYFNWRSSIFMHISKKHNPCDQCHKV